jgi:GntR family transcriptional regulator
VQIVDPGNPIPKYLQIGAWLKELIQTGRYKEGEKLPSEIKLAAMCGVNRNTLRQAVAELAAEGILRKERGTGTFVASSKPLALKHKLKRISSFGDDLKELGIQEHTRLLYQGVEPAPESVAHALVLGEDTQTVVIRRLRMGNRIPLIYEESYLPAAIFRGILDMDLTRSMYQTITERFNVLLARSEQSIRAVNLRGQIAAYLQLPRNAAALFMESVTFNERNVPVEVLWSYYRGDKCLFEVEVGRYHLKDTDTKFSLDKQGRFS